MAHLIYVVSATSMVVLVGPKVWWAAELVIATQDDLNGYSILQSVPAAEKKASAFFFFGASNFRTCMMFVHIA